MPKKSAKKSAVTKTADVVKKAVKRAGRPKGTGKYGCETKAVRIPIHLEEDVRSYILRKIKSGK